MQKIILTACLVLLGLPVMAQDIEVVVGDKTVVLHDNQTWEYKTVPDRSPVPNLVLTKDPGQQNVLKSTTNKFDVLYDSLAWDESKPITAEGEFGLTNKDKTGFAVVVYEGLKYPLSSLEGILVTNAKRVDPNARMLDHQPATINGTPGEIVEYTATATGISFTFLSFITSKDAGTIQYTFLTTSEKFASVKPDFLKALGGLEF